MDILFIVLNGNCSHSYTIKTVSQALFAAGERCVMQLLELLCSFEFALGEGTIMSIQKLNY